MRLAFLLLALASVLAWSAAWLRSADAEGEVVAAARAHAKSTLRAEAAPAPRSAARVGDAPPLFRPITSQGGSGARPGESFALVGIVARDAERIALLRDDADQRAWRVHVRDRVGGWTVARIGARCVLLRRGGARREYCL